jgi:hypothetical protein
MRYGSTNAGTPISGMLVSSLVAWESTEIANEIRLKQYWYTDIQYAGTISSKRKTLKCDHRDPASGQLFENCNNYIET